MTRGTLPVSSRQQRDKVETLGFSLLGVIVFALSFALGHRTGGPTQLALGLDSMGLWRYTESMAMWYSQNTRWMLSQEEQEFEELWDWVRDNGGFVRNVKMAYAPVSTEEGTVQVRGMFATRSLCKGTPFLGVPAEATANWANPRVDLPEELVRRVQLEKGLVEPEDGLLPLSEFDFLTLFLMVEYRKHRLALPSFWAPMIKTLKATEASYSTPYFWPAARLASAPLKVQETFAAHRAHHEHVFAELRAVVDERHPGLRLGAESYTHWEFVLARTAVESRALTIASFLCRDEVCDTSFASIVPGADLMNSDAALLNVYFYDHIAGHRAENEDCCAWPPRGRYGEGYLQALNNSRANLYVRTARSVPEGGQLWWSYFLPGTRKCEDSQIVHYGFTDHAVQCDERLYASTEAQQVTVTNTSASNP